MSSSTSSQPFPVPEEQQPQESAVITESGDRAISLDEERPDKVISTGGVSAAPLGEDRLSAPAASTPAGARLRDFWRLITSNRKMAVGLVIVTLFILIAIFGPLLTRQDPNALTADTLDYPSANHWLGTTLTGQDVFAQLMYGTRGSLFWGFLTGVIVTLISTAIGLVAGYFGGAIDDVISLIINVFLLLPGFPLAIILAAFFPVKGLIVVSVVITLTGWSYNARVLRAQTLSMRNRDFVEAARASGERTWRIIFFEILPNEISIVAAALIGTVIYVLVATVGLEYLGLGANDPSWGTMLFWAQNSDALFLGAWWWIIPPGLCVALVAAGLSLVNFGIDEIANPRLRTERNVQVKARKHKALSGKKAVAS